MLSNALKKHIDPRISKWGIPVLGGIILLSIAGALAMDEWIIALIPAALLFGVFFVLDFRIGFYLLLMTIPVSTELYLPGGFGLDFPDELFMLILLGTFILLLFNPKVEFSKAFFLHPLSLLLGAGFIWLVITHFYSGHYVISLKFLLAKVWYLAAFFFIGSLLLKDPKDWNRFVLLLGIPLAMTVLIILLRHGLEGFSFMSSNRVVRPFYRNHVSYAGIMAAFLPFFVLKMVQAKDKSGSWFSMWLPVVLMVLVGIYFSYTRAAILCIPIMIAGYFLVRFRLVRVVTYTSLMVALVVVGFFLQKNKYLDYAPDFTTTVAHRDFGNLVSATSEGKDISTMERVYRWVAAKNMFFEKPLMGFGPGTFVESYKPYTVRAFTTYVSDNPENSGIHSYYLMLLVEQGLPGLLLFLALVIAMLFVVTDTWHSTKDRQLRQWSMAVFLSTLSILAILIINDMIETDKIGSIFFINLVIMIQLNLRVRKAGKMDLNSNEG